MAEFRAASTAGEPIVWPVDPALIGLLHRRLAAEGIDLRDLLARCAREQGRRPPLQSPPVLGLADYFFLMERVACETGDETLLLSQRPLVAGTFHFVLSRTRRADTLADTLKDMADSFNYLHGGPYNTVANRDGVIKYAIDNTKFPYKERLSSAESNSLMECILILMHNLFSFICQTNLDDYLLAVWTKRKHDPDSPVPGHLGIFTQRICWGRPAYALLYKAEAGLLSPSVQLKDLPKPHAIYGVIASIIRERESGGVWHRSWTGRVRAALHRGCTSLEDVAAALHVAPRTLRRHLRSEGARFRQLRAELTNERARLLLAQGWSVDRVAEDLGYADTRSFRRAFVSWNGMTPAAFRTRV
ncbi:MAG: transcriptional regulator [Rhodothalassiaceae bacterium]|nr:MAG: transcriptional regulator [Rhodothalassiaceae bacterium]